MKAGKEKWEAKMGEDHNKLCEEASKISSEYNQKWKRRISPNCAGLSNRPDFVEYIFGPKDKAIKKLNKKIIQKMNKIQKFEKKIRKSKNHLNHIKDIEKHVFQFFR